MVRSYIMLTQALLLFCYICNFATSDSSRDSYNLRLEGKVFSCSQTANATATFRNNVNLLLSDFDVQSLRKSYYSTSMGDSTDKVYGYYMCRGDINQKTCNSCISNGTQFALQAECEHVDGILFSEKCIFRYSNHSMNGLLERTTPSTYDSIGTNVSNFQQFNQTLSPTIEAVINEAAFRTNNNTGSVIGFATKEANVGADETIYSLAQCTPDIVGTNCSLCLRSAFSNLGLSRGNQAPAAVATMAKCHLRYDTESFYDLGKSENSKGEGLRPRNLLAVYSVMFLFMYYSYFLLY